MRVTKYDHYRFSPCWLSVPQTYGMLSTETVTNPLGKQSRAHETRYKSLDVCPLEFRISLQAGETKPSRTRHDPVTPSLPAAVHVDTPVEHAHHLQRMPHHSAADPTPHLFPHVDSPPGCPLIPPPSPSIKSRVRLTDEASSVFSRTEMAAQIRSEADDAVLSSKGENEAGQVFRVISRALPLRPHFDRLVSTGSGEV